MASSSFVAHSLASISSNYSSSHSFVRPTENRSFSLNRSPTCSEWCHLVNHEVRAKANGFRAKSMSQDLGFDSSASENMINPTIIPKLKVKLLSSVSGLNRGLVANEEDLQKADDAAKELEEVGGVVDLSKDLEKLQGKWKLIYSSAFSSRTLGGSRPGPPTRRLLPITLGQVFQRIDILSKDFDNIVELELGAPWPLSPLEATATLAHKFELIGSSKIKIIFEKTTVKTSGNLAQLPPLEIPQIPEGLRPQSNRGTGDFEVTYLDDGMRITRGDRGELRVFVVS